MSAANLDIERIWLDRWNQRIEATLQGLAALQAERGWDELRPELLLNHQDQDEYTEALLLKSSLLRAEGLRQKSSVLLKQINSAWEKTKQPKPFRLLFELGLDHWVDLDLAYALEFFLLAEKKSTTQLQSIFALSNILWCLEALDLDRIETETKLEEALQRLPAFERSQATHVIEQWAAYCSRRAFYKNMTVTHDSGQGLSGFFQSWAGSLPYVENKSALRLPGEYLWQGSYRMRTLARIWIPADSQTVRVSDAIDRLYLWTWLYMAGHHEISREKILYTLDSILKDFEFEHQSKENLLLLRNSLGWLLILFPHLKSKLQKLTDRLERLASPNYPVLEAERDLMLSLAHPSEEHAAANAFPSFQKIYEELRSRFPILQDRLTPLMNQARHFDLIIDESRSELLKPHTGQMITSKPLTILLAKLSRQEQVKEHELGSLDLNNLLYRARKFLSPQSIRFKDGTVSRGPKWPKSLVLNDIEFSHYQAETMRPRLTDSETHLQAAKAFFPEGFKRKDIEKKLNVSKATANRMLEAWIQNGRLNAEGKAKAIHYHWSEV